MDTRTREILGIDEAEKEGKMMTSYREPSRYLYPQIMIEPVQRGRGGTIMVELVSIKKMPKELKIMLLKELKYDSDGIFVVKDGKKHLDKYTDEPVRVDNMFIFPGSTLILDNNLLSVSSFLEEYGDVL